MVNDRLLFIQTFLRFIRYLSGISPDDDAKGLKMSASMLVGGKTVAGAMQIVPAARGSVRRGITWWRRVPLRRQRPATTFQRCLALHMFVAQRASALD
jgi:hypothetical protein